MKIFVEHKANPENSYGYVQEIDGSMYFTKTKWKSINITQSLPRFCNQEEKSTKLIENIDSFYESFNKITELEYNTRWFIDYKNS